MSVCVYCGSTVGNRPAFAASAARFGALLANAGVRLVYGGGSIGLMGTIAREAIAGGGEVLGIIPGFLRDREVAMVDGGELIVTNDMHERKRAMFEQSDAFVALPGGIGTLEETVEMMTWVQLGRHRKPIVLANVEGFWDPLTAFFDHIAEAGFLHAPHNGGLLYRVVDDIDAVLPTVMNELDAGSADPDPRGGNTELM
ncbi:MAG: TIGR00730 family Rossman fold protein [Alphaproteobacteria bacterium]